MAILLKVLAVLLPLSFTRAHLLPPLTKPLLAIQTSVPINPFLPVPLPLTPPVACPPTKLAAERYFVYANCCYQYKNRDEHGR